MFEYEHSDDDRAGQPINYVTGECDTLLNYKTQDIFDVSVLDEKSPQQYWHPQASGTRIKDEVLPVLIELWTEVTKDYPQDPEESVYYVKGGTSVKYAISILRRYTGN